MEKEDLIKMMENTIKTSDDINSIEIYCTNVKGDNCVLRWNNDE